MSRPLFVDTNVLVQALRGHPGAGAFVTANAERMVFSAIVVAELYAGAKGDEELARLDKLLSAYKVVSVSAQVARAGAFSDGTTANPMA